MKFSNKLMAALVSSAFMVTSAFATPVTRNDISNPGDDTLASADSAVVETVGCASATSCTLAEFANGATMTVNGITMSNASIDFSQGEYDAIGAGDLEFYGIDNIIDPYLGGFGLRGASGFPFDMFGFATGDLDILFDISVASGSIVGLGAVSQIFAGSDYSSFLTLEGDNGSALDMYADDNGSDGLVTTSFGPTSTLSMTAALSNYANDDGYVFYDGFQFGVVAVPEPAPFILLFAGLIWMVRRKTV